MHTILTFFHWQKQSLRTLSILKLLTLSDYGMSTDLKSPSFLLHKTH